MKKKSLISVSFVGAMLLFALGAHAESHTRTFKILDDNQGDLQTTGVGYSVDGKGDSSIIISPTENIVMPPDGNYNPFTIQGPTITLTHNCKNSDGSKHIYQDSDISIWYAYTKLGHVEPVCKDGSFKLSFKEHDNGAKESGVKINATYHDSKNEMCIHLCRSNTSCSSC